MPSSPMLRVSRRATLRGVLTALGGTTAVLTAGCEGTRRSEGGTPVADAPGATPGSTATAAGPSDDEHDIQILDRAVASCVAAQAQLTATVTAHPGLGGALGGLTAMHAAHLDLLVASAAAEPPTPASARVPGRSRRALRAVRRSQDDHQQLLVRLALEARSGPFARVLASMAAAVGQQVAVLPQPGGPA